MEAVNERAAGPKYVVNIESIDHPWNQETITVPEIRTLGGFDPTQQIIEVDLKENTERTLGENETIELKPGQGFGKKVQFKRG
jgi:plastocyanin domain-containing protein